MFGSQPGSKILAVSACMPRFEAVLADAEVRRPRVACDPQNKDGSKQLSRKSSAIRLQPAAFSFSHDQNLNRVRREVDFEHFEGTTVS